MQKQAISRCSGIKGILELLALTASKYISELGKKNINKAVRGLYMIVIGAVVNHSHTAENKKVDFEIKIVKDPRGGKR